MEVLCKDCYELHMYIYRHSTGYSQFEHLLILKLAQIQNSQLLLQTHQQRQGRLTYKFRYY